MTAKLPFEQPTPSRAERRKSRRRLASRRTALAAALPAPDPAGRIDPLTGRPASPEGAPHRRSLRDAANAHPAGQAPASAPTVKSVKPPTRVGAFLRPRATFFATLARVVLAGVVLAMGLAAGLPILGHKLRLEWLLCAVIVVAVVAPGVRSRWGLLTMLQRVGVGLAGGLIAIFFVAGLASDPVVISGVVYPETSSTAEQVRYANGVRDDLLRLGQMDKYLASSTAEAWSRTDDIKDAKAEAEEIGQRYREIVDADGIPAGEFGEATSATVNASYAMSKALDLRLSLLAAQDDKLARDLATARDAFNAEWSTAGQALGQAVASLRIPLSVPAGPVES